jgi:hydrogen peroxide-dependent heme synthase
MKPAAHWRETQQMRELAPVTLEGWFALHQTWRLDRARLAAMDGAERAALADDAAALLSGMAKPARGGWSAAFQLIGRRAELLLVHLRPTLEELAGIDRVLRTSALGRVLRYGRGFTSVTDAALYHASAAAARDAEPGTPAHASLLREHVAAERATPHLQHRLQPRVPADMCWISFYPMSRRRSGPDNWYALPIAERDRLMGEHGRTGRSYAGRIVQIITCATGFDDWEWGVTLFARDPLEIKRIVTDMRYDEASARYAEFGRFLLGHRLAPNGWLALLGAVGDYSGARSS